MSAATTAIAPGTAFAQDHAALAVDVDSYVEDLLAAIGQGDGQAFGRAHAQLAAWSQFELVPTLLAAEQVLFPAVRSTRTELLIDALTAEHRVLAGLVDAVNGAVDAARLAGDAQALRVLTRSHLAALDLVLLPAADDVDLAAVREQAVQTAADLAAHYAAAVAADAQAAHSGGGCGSGACGCAGSGETDQDHGHDHGGDAGGCGGGGCGGLCSADDPRTQQEIDAAKAAVTVTRVD